MKPCCSRPWVALGGLLCGVALIGGFAARGSASHASVPASERSLERVTFAAGCFWGIEDMFRRTPGVKNTTVGYAGGIMAHPTYDDVCLGDTGHAESVLVEFDPAVISFDTLLEMFWFNHEYAPPDEPDPDFSSQYRSAIYYHSPLQRQAIESSKTRMEHSGRFRPITTQIEPAGVFYEAEEYHQHFLEKFDLESCVVPRPVDGK